MSRPLEKDEPSCSSHPGRVSEPGARTVIVAYPHGFCVGVRRALRIVEESLTSHRGAVYCLNEIVHNRQVVEDLARRGVRLVRSVEEVPSGACVVFSAHGVSPAVRHAAKARGLAVVDATCPFVARLHEQVQRFARRGMTVVLIGHTGHDEVIGLQGEAPDQILVVESRAEAETIQVADPRRVAVVAQTTLAPDAVEEVLQVLRRRFPTLETSSPLGICESTLNRQNAVRHLAQRTSWILILGSSHSSNTVRLAEVARTAGAKPFLVEAVEDLDRVPLDGISVLGLTAGASTPDRFLEQVLLRLRSRGFTRVEKEGGRREDVDWEG